MAVDFAVPLITNVKCAKILVEALVRRLPLDVSAVDYKTSHTVHTFPGLINVSAFVQGIAAANSKDFSEMTKASVSGGFTTAVVLPFGTATQILDNTSLNVAHANATGAAHCNYAFNIVASSSNVKSLDDELQQDFKALFVPFSGSFTVNSMSQQIAAVAAHFSTVTPEKPIVTDAKGSDLASVLLLASLHNRAVHVTDVRNRDDLLLISLSKAKQLKVTCDVSVYALFYTREELGAQCLPTKEAQGHLWSNLDVIDAFSIGTLPHELATELGHRTSAWSGVEETLPLLLSAVSDHKLTLMDVQQKLHDNPIRIFGLPDQSHTQVEVVIDRKSTFEPRKTYWSPLEKRYVTGTINRVVVHGQTVFLDGALFTSPLGRDVSSATITRPVLDRVARTSVSGQRPAFSSTSAEHTSSPTLTFASLKPVVDSVNAPLMAGQLTQLPPPIQTQMSSQLLIQPHHVPAPRVFSPLTPHPAFHRKHILSVKQFTHQDIHDLFSLAHEMRLQVERQGTLDILRGKVLATAFFEPSTRTSSSFDAAMKRCGGSVVSVAVERSSVQKGESLPDTIRTLGCYADAIVIRHPEVGSAQTAAKFSPIPIINAGDGIGEHPTQALLDIYTIRSELGTVNGRTITLLGDLKNGRTVHSLVTLLCLYSVRLNFVAPPSLSMPASVVSVARRAGVYVKQTESLEEVLAETDVLYVTRVQKERFTSEVEWLLVKDAYRIDHSVLSRAKEDMIVMHPMPRVNGKWSR